MPEELGGRTERPWDYVPLVPAATIPDLPWIPAVESGDHDSRLWLVFAAATGTSVISLLTAGDPRWWEMAGAAGLLMPLYETLRRACDRLAVTPDGLVVTGVLVKRRISWAAISRVEARRYQLTVELGRRGRRTWRFDGRKERPAAAEVGGVVERLRSLNTNGLARHRWSLSWGAAVFLPAATATAVAIARGVFGG
jgi:hypothetical protein